MEIDYEQKPGESFKSYMERILGEAKDGYDRMSPEDQQLLDEAAQRLGERVRSEIMASFPLGFEGKEVDPKDKENPSIGEDAADEK